MLSFLLAFGAGAALAAIPPGGACALLSVTEAAAAAAAPITRVKTTRVGDGQNCSYETGRPGRSVLLTVFTRSSRAEAAVVFESDVQANLRFYVQPPVNVSIGDGATAFGHVLWVRRANVIFVLNVIDARVKGATLDRAKLLARKIVARIDGPGR